MTVLERKLANWAAMRKDNCITAIGAELSYGQKLVTA